MHGRRRMRGNAGFKIPASRLTKRDCWGSVKSSAV